jgi:hypothetical protein
MADHYDSASGLTLTLPRADLLKTLARSRPRSYGAGDTFLTVPSAASSARLKVLRGELTASTRLWPGNVGGFIGRVARLCWSLAGGLFDLIIEEVLGDCRVSAGGGV